MVENHNRNVVGDASHGCECIQGLNQFNCWVYTPSNKLYVVCWKPKTVNTINVPVLWLFFHGINTHGINFFLYNTAYASSPFALLLSQIFTTLHLDNLINNFHLACFAECWFYRLGIEEVILLKITPPQYTFV